LTPGVPGSPGVNGGRGEASPHGIKRGRESDAPTPRSAAAAAAAAATASSPVHGASLLAGVTVTGANGVGSAAHGAEMSAGDAEELERLGRLRRRLVDPAPPPAPPASLPPPVSLSPPVAPPVACPPALMSVAQAAERAERVQVALREVFGLASFRPLQRDIVDAALDRKVPAICIQLIYMHTYIHTYIFINMYIDIRSSMLRWTARCRPSSRP
jgi:hypothetical protein